MVFSFFVTRAGDTAARNQADSDFACFAVKLLIVFTVDAFAGPDSSNSCRVPDVFGGSQIGVASRIS